MRAANGSVTYFLVNGESTRALGINDEGLIVGEVTDAEGARGFVVRLAGLPCESITVNESDLLEFPGYDELIPMSINNSGVVVGIIKDEGSHGFVAMPRSAGPLPGDGTLTFGRRDRPAGKPGPAIEDSAGGSEPMRRDNGS